ncbi:hypothetical protein DIPPA_01080 [Diplonema papillatum]|nr:hypothetical protein DIPPA_01080 [Diplonema papillatum]
MTAVSSFTASTRTRKPSTAVATGKKSESAETSACSCQTATTTRQQIETLEQRIVAERKAREDTMRQIQITAKELDLMEQLLAARVRS